MAPTDLDKTLATEIDPGAVPVVRARGELDLSTAPSLCATIDDAVSDARSPRVVIDLSDVEFCDSTGLRALVGAVREVEVLGGAAAVTVTRDGAVDRVLDLSGLREFLHVAPSREAALRRLDVKR